MNVRRLKVKAQRAALGIKLCLLHKAFSFSFYRFTEIIRTSGGCFMLMMCWFYCIPFAKAFFFASAPLLILLSMFILKRGIRQSRVGLRQLAFLLMFFAILKMFTIDIYLARYYILCAFGTCNDTGLFKSVQFAGLIALVFGSLFLFNLYRSFAKNRPQKEVTPDQVNLSFWANLSISLVIMLILWLAAPWAGYLTVGHVPQFFMQVPWQYLAIINIFVLLMGFWKLEDCIWIYSPKEKKAKNHQINVWTVKDTLWVSVILFAIALAFSYASNDVLSSAMPEKNSEAGFNLDKIDFSIFGHEFSQPSQ